MSSVLVVDDEPSIVAFLTDLLEAEGYTVIGAAGGREALRLAVALRPDLVLTDISMPFLDGLELTRRLHDTAATQTTPVVLMSAYHPPEQTAVTAVPFVAKPFDLTRLLDVLAQQVSDARS